MGANDIQRDQAVEGLLRRRAGAARTPGSFDACVDGETLAAWQSGALPPAEATRVETHLADCDRCQVMLATFARTEPVATESAESVGAVVVPFWKRRQTRWLVPLATAATVAAIWVAIPNREQRVEQSIASRETRSAESPAVSVPPPAASVPSEPLLVAPPARMADQSRAGAAANTQLQVDLKKEEREQQSSAAGQAARERDAAARRTEPAMDSFAPAPPAAAPVPQPAAPAPTPPPPPATALETQASARAPAPGALNESVALRSSAKVVGVEFASPDGAARWRVVNGRVERSTTRGKSWEAIPLPSAATISAGHAPSASVAWFVGANGAIFVTATGGAQFERVPFPHAVDLVSVTAIDAREATVRTSDGRTFRTTDRGATWN